MTAMANKERMTGVFDELARGNGKPFRDALAEDVRWTIVGTTRWSRTYDGKRAVMDELLAPLFSQFSNTYTSTPGRILADDDWVVVECEGEVTTTGGKPYDNRYCYVIQMSGGMMSEITEYCDTALIDAVLEPPS